MITLLFWLSVALLFYIYAGYPITIFIIARLLNKTPYKKTWYPSVGIVIAAHNEEKTIRNTIENKLSLNYPREKCSICVVSDASNDSTDSIVEDYRSSGIKLFRQDIRSGKTAALNCAVSQINSDIIVISDANSHFHKDALLHLVKN